MRYVFCLAALSLLAPLHAQEKKDDKKPAKPLHEVWQAAYLEGLKIGHGHILTVNATRNDKPVIRTTRMLDFVLKRYNSVLPIRQEQICEEDTDGNVVYLEETLTVAKDKKGPFKGVISGKKMSLTVPGQDKAIPIDFPEGVTGAYHQENIFAKKKVKAGDKLSVTSFELMLLTPLSMSIVVKDSEATDRLVLKKDNEKGKITREPIRLVRVDVKPGKIKINDTEIQLPEKKVWLDAKLMPVREQFEMPGVGAITLYSTTKEAALKEGVAPELLPDLGLNVSIPLKKTLDKPYDTTEVVYRVTTTEPLEKVFSVDDERQKVREEK